MFSNNILGWTSNYSSILPIIFIMLPGTTKSLGPRLLRGVVSTLKNG